MLIALSGTPGTGKSSVSARLQKEGYTTVSLNELAIDKNMIVGIDKKRNTKIIDVDRLDDYVHEQYTGKDLVFIEGHSSHRLTSAEKVMILRCHPRMLQKRLENQGWDHKKIRENVEAEALDIILCETVELHFEKHIFEIDTTDKTVESVVSSIVEIVTNKFQPMKNYKIGNIDWSEEIFTEF